MADSVRSLPTALQPTNVALAELAARLKELVGASEATAAATAKLSDGYKREAGEAERAGKAQESSWGNFRRVVGRGLTELGVASAAVGFGLSRLQQFTGAVTNQIGSLVALYNPAQFTRFKLAVDDTYAALGAALLPVLRNFIEVVKGIGSVFASLTPGGRALVAGLAAAAAGMVVMTGVTLAFSAAVNSATAGLAAVAGLFVGAFAGMAFAMRDTAGVAQLVGKVTTQVARVINGLGEALVPVVAAIQPIVDTALELFATAAGLVANVLEEAAPLVFIFASGLAQVTRWMTLAVREIAALLGLEVRQFPMRSAEGMAVRQVSVGSIESALSKAYASAFSIGTESPAVKAANIAEKVKALMEKIQSDVEFIRKEIIKYVAKVGEAVNSPGQIARGAVTGLDALSDMIGRLLRQQVHGK